MTPPSGPSKDSEDFAICERPAGDTRLRSRQIKIPILMMLVVSQCLNPPFSSSEPPMLMLALLKDSSQHIAVQLDLHRSQTVEACS